MRLNLGFNIVLCIFIHVSFSEDGSETKMVQIAQGPVIGYKNEKGFYSFMNIPYASVPTGTHRYKAPLPPPVWIDPYKAVDRRIVCPQFIVEQMLVGEMFMQEDCLVANVHVPDTKEINLPVYVIIHGGAFNLGFGDILRPTTLITKHNIITVTFNYRLGPHGFLCLGTEDVPGNAGMKDQVALLKWVQKNIASFGGNPNDVTIGGCSAGGASVDLLTVSKAAEGLFHKAIPESGAIAHWSTQRDPIETAKVAAKEKNFTAYDDLAALEEYYKTTPFGEIYNENLMMITTNDIPFSPCVEKPIRGVEPFLDEDPMNYIKDGNYKQVPLLYGFTSMEGLIKVYLFDSWKDQMNKNFSNFLPSSLKFKDLDEKIEVAKYVKKFYFGENDVEANEDSILGFINFVGDVIIGYPQLKAVELRLKHGHDQIYLYEYLFVDKNDPIIPYTNTRGANHCFQVTCAYDGSYSNLTQFEDPIYLTAEYKKMASITSNLWANFIKTGKPVVNGSPVPEWPAVKHSGTPYISLGNEVKLVKKPLGEKMVKFWNKLYDKYYREAVPPTPSSITHSEL